LTVLFFWVQVYPYVEAERAWPKRLLAQESLAPSTLQLPDEAHESELSSALPYFSLAGWKLGEEGAYRLELYPAADSTQAGQVRGRVILRQNAFGVVPVE
jgi:hypothetical protein